jgi:hypothetical protein
MEIVGQKLQVSYDQHWRIFRLRNTLSDMKWYKNTNNLTRVRAVLPKTESNCECAKEKNTEKIDETKNRC